MTPKAVKGTLAVVGRGEGSCREPYCPGTHLAGFLCALSSGHQAVPSAPALFPFPPGKQFDEKSQCKGCRASPLLRPILHSKMGEPSPACAREDLASDTLHAQLLPPAAPAHPADLDLNVRGDARSACLASILQPLLLLLLALEESLTVRPLLWPCCLLPILRKQGGIGCKANTAETALSDSCCLGCLHILGC